MAEKRKVTKEVASETNANVQTSKSIKETNRKQYTQAQIDAEIKKAGADLQKADKVEITIPKYLTSRLGTVVPVGINGAVIYIPVGKKVKVPKPFKKIIEDSLNGLEL